MLKPSSHPKSRPLDPSNNASRQSWPHFAGLWTAGSASVSSGTCGDRATHLLVSMFASVGLGDTLTFRAPSDTAFDLMGVDPVFVRKIEKALSDLYDRTLDLLRLHRTTLEAIADALVEKRFLSGADVESVMAKTAIKAPPT